MQLLPLPVALVRPQQEPEVLEQRRAEAAEVAEATQAPAPEYSNPAAKKPRPSKQQRCQLPVAPL